MITKNLVVEIQNLAANHEKVHDNLEFSRGNSKPGRESRITAH